jgi:hypothetical protein
MIIDDFLLEYENISVLDSALIDKDSYDNNQYVTLLEYKSALNNIRFTLKKNNKIVFDSKINSVNNLDFKLAMKICNHIHNELNLNKHEIENYKKDLQNDNFILPETIIANLIKNDLLKLSLNDLKQMSTKDYEKLQLALNGE